MAEKDPAVMNQLYVPKFRKYQRKSHFARTERFVCNPVLTALLHKKEQPVKPLQICFVNFCNLQALVHPEMFAAKV